MGNRAFALVSPNLEPERPAYNGMAMGCGLEDKGLTEKAYLAMEYGWEEALERYEEDFPIWEELEPETVTRCCDRHDIPGNVLFEGDVYRNPDNLLFEICYGKYMAFCPADKAWMESVGFFAVSRDVEELYQVKEPMPLGTTEDYAYLVGNVFDNPELSQAHKEADSGAAKGAAQPVLMPAT